MLFPCSSSWWGEVGLSLTLREWTLSGVGRMIEVEVGEVVRL